MSTVGPSPRCNVVALVAVVVLFGSAALPAAASSSTRPDLLRLAPLQIGGKLAPVVARATVPAGSELRVALNGNRVKEAFLHSRRNTFLARLGVPEGVRHGENRLKVVAIGPAGNRDVARRRFHFSRDVPLASAGPDRRMVVGDSIELNAGATHPVPGTGGAPDFRWRIVDSPSSSDAVASGAAAGEDAGGGLREENTETPIFDPPQAGTYMIEVSVEDGGEVSHDAIVVPVRPNDPPIGARLEVNDGFASGRIKIDGQMVPGTAQAGIRINYAMLDRTTRQAPACLGEEPYGGTVANTTEGIKDLEALVSKCSSTSNMLILGAARGLMLRGSTQAVDELANLLKMIGGCRVPDDSCKALIKSQRDSLSNGSPRFSVIGVPGAPGGSAFISVNGNNDQQEDRGRLSGYLQVNTKIDEYGFVFSDYKSFDTQAPGLPAGRVGMTIGGATVDDATEGTAGFQVVTYRERYEPYNPSITFHGVFAVNTGDAARDAAAQSAMADRLRTATEDDLVFVQSYGNPKPTHGNWDLIAQEIRRLGGTRTAFDQLDGTGGYAFVGRPCEPAGALGCNVGYGGSAAAVEAGPTINGEPAHLSGTLGRDHDGLFTPEAVGATKDPTTHVVNDLLPAVYAPPTPFAKFTGEQEAAYTYISKQLFDPPNNTDLRALYVKKYGLPISDWQTVQGKLNTMKYPTEQPNPCSCSEADFTTVRTKLYDEVTDLISVRGWIEKLQALLEPKNNLYFDLEQIKKAIEGAVKPPDRKEGFDPSEMFGFGLEVATLATGGSEATQKGVEVMSLILNLGKLLAGSEMGENGAPLLGEVEESTTEFIKSVGENYETTRSTLTTMGLIAVSDPAKLKRIATEVRGDWAFPPDDVPLRLAINKGFKEMMYSELLPMTYSAWRILPFKPGDSVSANSWNCSTLDDPHARYPVGHRHYSFRGAPPASQLRVATGFGATELYVLGVRTFNTGALPRATTTYGDALPPPASLMDPLFKPLDKSFSTDNLGLFPQVFLERNFTPRTDLPREDRDCY